MRAWIGGLHQNKRGGLGPSEVGPYFLFRELNAGHPLGDLRQSLSTRHLERS